MLLPSALSCESSQPLSKPRSQPALIASPPLSPPSSSSHSAITNLYSTCRALQSMLTTPSQLPSPPTIHAEPPSSPIKLRLRARKSADEKGSAGPISRTRITKRAQAPPRGANKRRRALDDDMSRESGDRFDSESEDELQGPSTPKRQRIAPEVLPLGLDRSDFHTLHLKSMPSTTNSSATGCKSEVGEEDKGMWSSEEDRILVELVLEKLKLSRSDWQDCARSLGRDRGEVGKRWKSLVGAGEVGVKNGHRRGKIHGTWR